jgi:peptidoglycan/LPS O-acetylase OafA/YrhL
VAPRIDALDGIRALAVIAVLGYHAHYRGFHGGFIGVDVFFVLSGFLITRLLLERDMAIGFTRAAYRRFLVRRATRLVPAFVVMLAGAGVVSVLTATPHHRATALPCAALAAGYAMNLPAAEHLRCAAVWHVSWSLAAEQQFYLGWPLLLSGLLAASKRVRRRVASSAGTAPAAVATAGLLVLALVWQLGLRLGGAPAARILFAPDGRSLIILAGCALALALHRTGRRDGVPAAAGGVVANVLGLAACAALAATVVTGSGGGAPEDMLAVVAAGAGTTLLIALIATGRAGVIGVVLATRALTWIGRLSYSLYLWHEVAYRIANNVATEGTVRCETLRIALAFGLASLSYRFVESRRWQWFRERRRIEPRQTGPAARPAPQLAQAA